MPSAATPDETSINTNLRSVSPYLVELNQPAGRAGCGMLLWRGLLLTCDHIMRSQLQRRRTRLKATGADFDGTSVGDRVFESNSLDCVVVGVSGDSARASGLLERTQVTAADVGEALFVVEARVGYREQPTVITTELIGLVGPFLQYQAPTRHGSSGAAIFNERWELVGMHQRRGYLVVPDGSISMSSQGVAMTDVIASIDSSRTVAIGPRLPFS